MYYPNDNSWIPRYAQKIKNADFSNQNAKLYSSATCSDHITCSCNVYKASHINFTINTKVYNVFQQVKKGTVSLSPPHLPPRKRTLGVGKRGKGPIVHLHVKCQYVFWCSK